MGSNGIGGGGTKIFTSLAYKNADQVVRTIGPKVSVGNIYSQAISVQDDGTNRRANNYAASGFTQTDSSAISGGFMALNIGTKVNSYTYGTNGANPRAKISSL